MNSLSKIRINKSYIIFGLVTITTSFFLYVKSKNKRKKYYDVRISTSFDETPNQYPPGEFVKDPSEDLSIHASFINNNNIKLHARLYESTAYVEPGQEAYKSTRPFVIFLHGIGTHVNRYPINKDGITVGNQYIAQLFLKKGFNFYSYDAQGHGLSNGDRCYIEDWKTYIDDADQFISLVRSRCSPETPFFLMGESFGGGCILHLAQRLEKRGEKFFKGCFFNAPALKCQLPPLPVVWLLRYVLCPLLPWYIPPFMPDSIPASSVWEDEEVGKWITKNDTLGNGDKSLRLSTAVQILGMIEAAQDMIKKGLIKFPWACAHGNLDFVVPLSGSKYLEKYSINDVVGQQDNELMVLEGGYHDLLTGRTKDDVIDFFVTWARSILSKNAKIGRISSHGSSSNLFKGKSGSSSSLFQLGKG